MQKLVRQVLDHWTYNVWIFIVTIYALFADDLRLAATSLPADPVFFSLSCVAMFCFALELVASSLVKDDYWLGFYFWLDLLATVSMISDIGWAWEAILGTDQGGSTSSGVTKSTQLARAARASRAGTRAGRILRLVRIIRLIRLVKLYKIAQQAKFESHGLGGTQLFRSYVTYRGGQCPVEIPEEQTVVPGSNSDLSVSQSLDMDQDTKLTGDNDCRPSTTLLLGSTRTSAMFEYGRISGPKALPEEFTEVQESSPESLTDIQPYEESNVGHRLSEITTKRVILLVLGMMFMIPLFSTTMYVDENDSYTYALTVLDKSSESPTFDLVWEHFLSHHKDLFTPVVYIQVLNRRTWEKTDPNDLRSVEQQIVVLDQTTGSRYYVNSI